LRRQINILTEDSLKEGLRGKSKSGEKTHGIEEALVS
jgi:hypothetical protein